MGFRAVPAATRLFAYLCVASTAACALAIGLDSLTEVPCVGACDDGGDATTSTADAAADTAADAPHGDEGDAGDASANGRDASDAASERGDGASTDAAPEGNPDSSETGSHDGGDGAPEGDAPIDAPRDATEHDGDGGEAGVCPCLTGYMRSDGTCIGYTPPGGACLPPGLVALPRTGWVASASPNGADGGDLAANAIDGVECSRFSTDVNQASGQWFQLDMGASFAFSVVVLDGTADTTDFPSHYQLSVSGDGVNWGSPVTSGLGSSSGVTTIVFPEQNARYIRIQLTAAAIGPWSIDEIKVFSTHPPAGTPVPLSHAGWTASASVNASSAPLGIDGNLTTRFTTMTNATAGMWFEVDMGKPTSFSEITMDTYGNGPGCTDFARFYAVYVSMDGTNWTAAAMGTDMAAIVVVTLTPQTTRYIQVQLTQTAGPWWSIGEFDVYTPSP